jgi:hypothetical protein
VYIEKGKDMTKETSLVISDYTAYELGKKGIKVTKELLSNHLNSFTAHALEVKENILTRRVKGMGAFFQHLLAVIFGLGIFFLALVVDYNIIHEFWVRMLSNEFMEVPAAMVTSVMMKSLQVLFATLSIHYLISHLGHRGRVAFVAFIFMLTSMMIGGIGLLYAYGSLPIETQSVAVEKFLDQIGVKRESAVVASTSTTNAAFLKPYETYVWMSSLSVLFFIVASIGSLALHSATRGFTGMTGGALYDISQETNRGNRYRNELAQVRIDRKKLTEDPAEFRESKIADFAASYTTGVVDGRHSQATMSQLLLWLEEAIGGIKNG